MDACPEGTHIPSSQRQELPVRNTALGERYLYPTFYSEQGFVQPGENPGQTGRSDLTWCCSWLAEWSGPAAAKSTGMVCWELCLCSHRIFRTWAGFHYSMAETPSGPLGCSLIQFCCDLSFMLKSGLGTLFCYWDFVDKCSLIVSLPECFVFPSLQKAAAPICVGQLSPKPFLLLPEGM